MQSSAEPAESAKHCSLLNARNDFIWNRTVSRLSLEQTTYIRQLHFWIIRGLNCITFWSYFDTYSAIQWEDTVREIYCEVYFDQIHSWSSAIHLWCTISINSQLWEGCAGTYKDISGTQRGAEWKHLRYIRRLQESKKVWRRAGVVDCKNNPRCWCSYHGLEVAQEECG